MLRQGFTLIEILAVIVIISIITAITLPIINDTLEGTYARVCLVNSKSMEKAAEKYITLSSVKLPTIEGRSVRVTLRQLNEAEYLTQIVDPKTKEACDADRSYVTITKKGNTFTYTSKLSCNSCGSSDDLALVGDEVIDGWILLNLQYPEDSTDRMWRLSEEGEVRSGSSLNWVAYTGPIKIPANRTSDVWLSYTLNGEEIVIPPAGRLLVNINVSPTIPNQDAVTVTINYDKDATIKEYRIGNSDWITYINPFTVTENTIIEARVKKTEDIYDTAGTLISQNEIGGRDLVFVGNISNTENANEAPTIVRLAPVNSSEVARIKVTYPVGATNAVFKINYGAEEAYTGDVSIEKSGTFLIAYYYDASGNRSKSKSIYINSLDGGAIAEQSKDYVMLPEYTPSSTNGTVYDPANPSTVVTTPSVVGSPFLPTQINKFMPAPIINITPATLVEEVTVSVDSPALSSSTYIRIGNGSYQKYTSPIKVDQNTTISAYYIKDGFKSDAAYSRISNIKLLNYPHVKIETTYFPYASSYDSGSTGVTVTYTDSTINEYSLNGIIYYPYTGKVTISENTRFYARGTNATGTIVEYIDITNVNNQQDAAVENIPTKLAVDITAIIDPAVVGSQDEVKVSINYDKNATEKYYRLGSTGTLMTYTEPFTVTENVTVYAYALNGVSKGETAKVVDNLNAGFAAPMITISPVAKISDKVEVTINYDKNAIVKRYKLNSDTYIDYSGSFIVDKNDTVITALSQSKTGSIKTSTHKISNIFTNKNAYINDMGEYYIIKLSYPINASSKEYKWLDGGTWNEYNEAGILLIKSEYQDDLIIDEELVKITDENGFEVNFAGDYYILSTPISEFTNNLFMRWSDSKPDKPVITLSPTDLTKEVTATITFGSGSTLKQYKIVTETGTTGWINYTTPIKIIEHNAVIYARSATTTGVYSDVASRVATNVDGSGPEIELTKDIDSPTVKVGVRVSVTDANDISLIKYAQGSKNISYFASSGTTINNMTIEYFVENGVYTFYSKDELGNESVKEISITNIDLDAPEISIELLDDDVIRSDANVIIFYGDSTLKEYKVGANTTTWSTYTAPLALSSAQIISQNLQNDDYTVTVSAKGKDDAGNEVIVSKKILTIDLNQPKVPIIDSNYGYPIMTIKGMIYNGQTTIKFDNSSDVDNYYSTNGTTWIKYTGPFEASAGTIYAKSVKKYTYLTATANKTIILPTDAIGSAAYDGSDATYFDLTGAKYLKVDPSLEGLTMRTRWYTNRGGYVVYGYMHFMDENRVEISKVSNYGALIDSKYQIPIGTRWIAYSWAHSQYGTAGVYDVQYSSEPSFTTTDGYMKLNIDPTKSITSPYQMVKINYTPSSVERLYRIGSSGDWLVYKGETIKVNQGETIYAKGFDKDGIETRIVSSHTANVANAIGSAGLDGNFGTSFISKSAFMELDSSLNGKLVQIKSYNSNNTNYGYISFYNSSGATLATLTLQQLVTYNGNYSIPVGAVRMSISGNENQHFYEIQVVNEPTVTTVDGYAELNKQSSLSIKIPYQMVTINYHSTSVQKLYKIGTGSWLPYTGPVKVNQGETIYAKGKDINGIETRATTSHTVSVPTSVQPLAIDGNFGTGYLSVYSTILNIHPNMYGQKIDVKTWDTESNGDFYIYFIGYQSQNLGSIKVGYRENNRGIYTVPEGTKYMSIPKPVNLYEIAPVNSVTFNASTKELTNQDVILELDSLEPTDIIHYSYDNVTFQLYENPLVISANKTVYAKIVYPVGSFGTQQYAVTNINKTLPIISYPANTNVNFSNVGSYDVMKNVTLLAHTNLVVTGNLSAIPGEYFITYTVTDMAGNITNNVRKFTITEGLVYDESYIYVSATGNDTTGTGEKDTPYQTLDKALAIVPNNGTIYILGKITLTSKTYDFATIAKNVTFRGNYLQDGSTIEGTFGLYGRNYTVNFIGLYINVLNSGVWSEVFVYSYDINIYNSVFNEAGTSYSNVYYDNGFYFENSLILRMGSIYNTTNFKNCAFKTSVTGAATFDIKLNNVTYDSNFNITSAGWQNTGLLPGGGATHIGVYGGQYYWE